MTAQRKDSPPKIVLQGMTKSFGDKQVLRGIDLEVAAKESLAIIGTSGCGKSVTLKCLLGLLRADGGSIRVDGEEMINAGRHQMESMRQRFGMTFQFGALFDSLPIWENVTFSLRQRQHMTRQQARDAAAETITQLGLAAHVIDQYPAELSGGMQKRVALARAIADKPEILLFDEPTSGLDPITGGVIDRLIIDSVNRLGATAVTISHDMASVRRIADKVAMVHNGVIIWCGPASEMDNSGVEEVHQFVHGLADGPLPLAAQAEARRGGWQRRPSAMYASNVAVPIVNGPGGAIIAGPGTHLWRNESKPPPAPARRPPVGVSTCNRWPPRPTSYRRHACRPAWPSSTALPVAGWSRARQP